MSARDPYELWIKAAELGFRRHSSNYYYLIRKYTRRAGYSVTPKQRYFNGSWSSGRAEKFKTWEEVLDYLENGALYRVSREEVLAQLLAEDKYTRMAFSSEIRHLQRQLGVIL